MRLGTDSEDYFILQQAAENIKNVPGILIEIGVREGGSIQYIVDGLQASNTFNRVIIGLDPWGDLPYEWQEGQIAPWTYSNEMRKRAYQGLYNYTFNKFVELHLLTLTDDQYFEKYSSGFPVYSVGSEYIINNYCLVHFDGPHSVQEIKKEIDFFKSRSPIGTIWVFDDIKDFYDHSQIEQIVFENGFELFNKANKKASYRKVK